MRSLRAVAEFLDVLKNDPDNAYDFICHEYHRLSKDDLITITKELLYGIHDNCSDEDHAKILSSVADEIDSQYDNYE